LEQNICFSAHSFYFYSKNNQMKNLPLIITLTLFSFVTSNASLIEKSGNKESQQNTQKTWKLVWADEFDKNGLPDTTRWNYDTRGNDYGWGNNEKQWYTVAKPENCRIENGILKITARKEKTGNKEYSSARLTTKNKGDWKYGKIEVRAKLPTGNGTWPAIWMLPTDSKYGGWPKCGEIDIMEHVGFDPDTVFSTVHTGKFNHMIGTQVGKKTGLPTATSDFHIYTTEWEENEIRSYVDGKHYFTFKNNGEGFESWPFDQPFHLILNLAIGGGLGGKKGIDDSKFPHTFEIDYVRVYQK
jgi:beta-glucanase (GH16 family)